MNVPGRARLAGDAQGVFHFGAVSLIVNCTLATLRHHLDVHRNYSHRRRLCAKPAP